MDEVVSLLARILLRNTEFLWIAYGHEIVIPDYKIIFFDSDLDRASTENYMFLNKRPVNPWLCIPIPYWDQILLEPPEGFDEWSVEQQTDYLTRECEDHDVFIVKFISGILSSVIALNGDEPFKEDKDNEYLNDIDMLKEFIETLPTLDEEEEEDDEEESFDEDYEQVEEQDLPRTRDLVDIANLIGCSCTALERVVLQQGWYDSGFVNIIVAGITGEEYLRSRKRAYFVNTGDFRVLGLGENFVIDEKDIPSDKN